jgi:hypothetical protein
MSSLQAKSIPLDSDNLHKSIRKKHMFLLKTVEKGSAKE